MTTCTCRQHLNAAFEGRRFYFNTPLNITTQKAPEGGLAATLRGERVRSFSFWGMQGS